MATQYKYPFKSSEELKAAISQVDSSIDLANMASSMLLASRDMKDIISKSVWDLMMKKYHDEQFSPALSEGKAELLNELIPMCQGACGNFGLFHHFIWMQIRVSNAGITTLKNNTETTAYKYQTDEAKDKLLEAAYLEVSEIIDFLETNKTDFSEWTGSAQYTYLQKLVIKDYRDFNEHYEIGHNAAFFIRSRFLQQEVIYDHILPRLALDEMSDEVKLTRLVKKAVVFKTMALAVRRFDYFMLPEVTRKEIGNEFYASTRFRDIDLVKEKLCNELDKKGDTYLRDIDMYQSAKDNTDATVNTYENLDQSFDADLPFVAIV